MDVMGKPFGRLTVREYLGRDPQLGLHMYRCECSCKPSGAQKIVSRKNLVNGSVKSCGCLKHVPRPNADQTRYYAAEVKRASAMRTAPKVPYKIVHHR